MSTIITWFSASFQSRHWQFGQISCAVTVLSHRRALHAIASIVAATSVNLGLPFPYELLRPADNAICHGCHREISIFISFACTCLLSRGASDQPTVSAAIRKSVPNESSNRAMPHIPRSSQPIENDQRLWSSRCTPWRSSHGATAQVHTLRYVEKDKCLWEFWLNDTNAIINSI